jgi:hypothetical protein
MSATPASLDPFVMTPDEKAVGVACDKYARAAGFTVESYEQRRPSGIFKGIPDRRYSHAARGLRIWIELKAPGGQMTEEQHRWLLIELKAGAYAAVVDDVAQLQHLFKLMTGPRVGRDEAVLRYCHSLVDHAALRGYRGQQIPDHLRKRARPGQGKRARRKQTATG